MTASIALFRPPARASTFLAEARVRFMSGVAIIGAAAKVVCLKAAWPVTAGLIALVNLYELLLSPNFARACASLAAFASLAYTLYLAWQRNDRAQLLQLVHDVQARAAIGDAERAHLMFQVAQLSEQALRRDGVLAASGDRLPIRPGVPPAAVEVLVVEDEKAGRDALGRVLRHYSFRASSVGSVAEAVETIRRREASGSRFDFVILDLLLPDGSGLDVLEAARLIAPGTDVIVTTGVVDDRAIELARDKGAAKVLRKPYPLPELLAKLGVVVEERPGGPA